MSPRSNPVGLQGVGTARRRSEPPMGDVEVHVGQRIRHEVIGVVDRSELIIVVVQR